ncbi:peptidylprolyl isomerase [Andreprevotia lacus]|nr:peptidylprolyl isomerase [Andreprevotia lacus]
MKPILTATLLALAFCSSGYAQTAKPPAIKVQCKTTKGDLDITIEPTWAPLGAARFAQMVDDGFFKDVPLFRCVNGFLCQFGTVPPSKDAKSYVPLADDPLQPARRSFKRGYISFAGSGPGSRTNHLFFTLGEKVDSLGTQPWEAPIGYVSGPSLDKVLGQFNTGYGDMPPWGHGPDPQKIAAADGAAYLQKNFPQLDYLRSCKRK